MNLLENIRANKELNELLMRECDIYFYKEEQEIEFSGNNEVYSLGCMAFAQDGTGSEYVFLEDGSIGFISSEGEVGRVAESLEDLLTFLIHVGCISDFSCKYIYKKEQLLEVYCNGYLSRVRTSYKDKNVDWDKIRGDIANKLGLSFEPDKLSRLAMAFYKSASREPIFSCKYADDEDEYICDSVLSDMVGIWELQLLGIEKMKLIRVQGLDLAHNNKDAIVEKSKEELKSWIAEFSKKNN